MKLDKNPASNIGTYTGTIIWDDNNNVHGYRPQQMTVTVGDYALEEAISTKEIEINQTGDTTEVQFDDVELDNPNLAFDVMLDDEIRSHYNITLSEDYIQYTFACKECQGA